MVKSPPLLLGEDIPPLDLAEIKSSVSYGKGLRQLSEGEATGRSLPPKAANAPGPDVEF